MYYWVKVWFWERGTSIPIKKVKRQNWRRFRTAVTGLQRNHEAISALNVFFVKTHQHAMTIYMGKNILTQNLLKNNNEDNFGFDQNALQIIEFIISHDKFEKKLILKS